MYRPPFLASGNSPDTACYQGGVDAGLTVAVEDENRVRRGPVRIKHVRRVFAPALLYSMFQLHARVKGRDATPVGPVRRMADPAKCDRLR